MNSVFHFNLQTNFRLYGIVCNKDVSYEPELFPAMLISKWLPIHITLFPNGKGIITGVRLHSEAIGVMSKLAIFLRDIKSSGGGKSDDNDCLH